MLLGAPVVLNADGITWPLVPVASHPLPSAPPWVPQAPYLRLALEENKQIWIRGA
ncbi:hypothetical protein GQ53DRAFT_748265, partial [Thozetella sp. PMI_491]